MIENNQRKLALEIAESLKQGDHLRHDNQLARAIVSLALLLLLPFGSRRALSKSSGDITLALANPVGHGRRFGVAIREALEDSRIEVLADRRIADSEMAGELTDFPSLTIRSMTGLVSFSALWTAVKLRRKVRLKPDDFKLARTYLEVLFLLQAVRYAMAASMIAELPASHLWLTDFDRHAYSRPLIWQAKKLGRRTATMVHGTPGKTYIPFIAQTVLVWGRSQAEWVHAIAPEATVHIVGRPELSASVSPAQARRLRVVHSMEQLTVLEVDALREVCQAARRASLDISFRLHPSASKDLLDRQWLDVIDQADIETPTTGFLESLCAGDLVVGVSSTAIVDALAVGLPAWVIADPSRQLPCDLEFLKGHGGSPTSILEYLEADDGLRDVYAERLSNVRTSLVASIGKESASTLHHALTQG